MDKQEFLDRLTNSERYQIIDGFNRYVSKMRANQKYRDIQLVMSEPEPYRHTITAYSDDRDKLYCAMSFLLLMFPKGIYDCSLIIDEYYSYWAAEFQVCERKYSKLVKPAT